MKIFDETWKVIRKLIGTVAAIAVFALLLAGPFLIWRLAVLLSVSDDEVVWLTCGENPNSPYIHERIVEYQFRRSNLWAKTQDGEYIETTMPCVVREVPADDTHTTNEEENT